MSITITIDSSSPESIQHIVRACVQSGLPFHVEWADEPPVNHGETVRKVTPPDWGSLPLASDYVKAASYDTVVTVRYMGEAIDSFSVLTALECPTCKAPRGFYCMTGSGSPARAPHTARVRAYFAVDGRGKPVGEVTHSGGYEPEPVPVEPDSWMSAWAAVHKHACPRCHVPKGAHCISKSGRELNIIATHRGRINLVR